MEPQKDSRCCSVNDFAADRTFSAEERPAELCRDAEWICYIHIAQVGGYWVWAGGRMAAYKGLFHNFLQVFVGCGNLFWGIILCSAVELAIAETCDAYLSLIYIVVDC